MVQFIISVANDVNYILQAQYRENRLEGYLAIVGAPPTTNIEKRTQTYLILNFVQ